MIKEVRAKHADFMVSQKKQQFDFIEEDSDEDSESIMNEDDNKSEY